MTSPAPSTSAVPRFRVLVGRREKRRPFAPWIGFCLVLIAAFVGIVLSRTALDRGAFELAELQTQIAVAESEHERLRLEIARLENPARISPLAEELGFVYPDIRFSLPVAGVIPEEELPLSVIPSSDSVSNPNQASSTTDQVSDRVPVDLGPTEPASLIDP